VIVEIALGGAVAALCGVVGVCVDALLKMDWRL